jgi:putative tricarboxylic transport membrane protein
MVLALVLGDKAEDSFRQSMLMSQGDVGVMWSNPLVGTITTFALLMLFWPLISKLLALVRSPKVKPAFADEQPVD